MKRIIIIVIALLIIVSIVFNIKSYKDLKSLEVLNETIQGELVESQKVAQSQKAEIQTLENKLSDSLSDIKVVEENLKLAELEMVESKELVKAIDDRLEGNGETIAKLDKLLNENTNLKTTIEKLTIRINDLDDQSLTGDDIEDQAKDNETDELVRLSGIIKTWMQDVQETIDFIDSRKVDLESASDTLPVLSLERIMINQEIDFLEESINELKSLKDEMNTSN